MNQVFAFEVWLGPDGHRSQINARSAGAARYSYYLDAREWAPDVRLIDVRVRKIGDPVTSESHRRVMMMRGRDDLVAGARVVALGREGAVVGVNSSGNFDVLLDGQQHAANYHPTDLEVLP